MQIRAADIARTLEIRFEEGFDKDYSELEKELMSVYDGMDIKLDETTKQQQGTTFTIQQLPNGSLARVAEIPLLHANRPVLMTVSMIIEPQTEILRAFRNQYLVALMIVFIVALLLMIYFIGKALRPLVRLSESCAAIGKGHLETVSTHGGSGEILALEKTFNDMVHSLREKEVMERKLLQAQRLSALGNLAAGVAHDIRNPLNAIKLLSSAAWDSLDEESHLAKKSLGTIREEVDRLEEIISGFLSLAKETEINPELTDLDELLADCVKLFQKDAEARGVRLLCELHSGNTTLLLDPKQWKRAILNIILNALEACPPGGRVRIFSRRTDSHCEIEIRDDGPGIPQEVIERIFEPYFTTKPGGTGLGLAITRGIIEEHGGEIDITSSSGLGCQVLITIPLNNHLFLKVQKNQLS